MLQKAAMAAVHCYHRMLMRSDCAAYCASSFHWQTRSPV